ncbi:MAG: class I SAM-dependent methyltransferase [Candidatus Heimdallarchaeaceae archaeon]
MKIKSQLQEVLEGIIPNNLLDKIPTGYAITGDIAIVRFRTRDIDRYKEVIGEAIINADPRVKVVVEQLDTKTIFRKPMIKHVAGEKRTQTIHKEFGTLFHIDIAKLTFSPGNKREREFLINNVKENETIVDMFACVGNLSLAIAVQHPTAKIFAVEKNPEAFHYLIKNIKINKVEERYYPILGDNREKTPEDIASRVLMGYFGIDTKQLYCAVKAIRERGWIHYHALVSRDSINKVERYIKKMSEEIIFRIIEMQTRTVKKFSPRKIHLCLDIFIEK